MVDPEELKCGISVQLPPAALPFVAARGGFEIDEYMDEAAEMMAKGENGVPWVRLITLRPRIVCGGEKRPTLEEEARLHHMAHEQRFIANAIKTEVVVRH